MNDTPPLPRVGNSLINRFAEHKVAANLLMLLMIFVGLWALTRLNVQFLPTFIVNEVSIEVPWRGASAEDVQRAITIPIEQEIRDVDFIKSIRSTSRLGFSLIVVEFEQGTNMGEATERLRERVNQVRNLPQASEPVRVTKREHFDPIAKLIIQSPGDLEEIRPIIHRIETELLDAGIAKITVRGLPELKVAVTVPVAKIAELHVSLVDIARIIAQRSQDVPAGTVGESQTATQIRANEQQRHIRGFAELPLLTDRTGQLIRLGDIAHISKQARSDAIEMRHHGNPAVEMQLLRASNANSLTAAKQFKAWLTTQALDLPETITLTVYDESWLYIKGRINLLLKNGAGGLLLILGILFLFLNARIAFWVAVGIPISFLAALAILSLAGGSINMVSLFAMIMSLGIIVDDTIVVSEETLSLIQKGVRQLDAVKRGAQRMLVPVMASSLTTIAAFLPLMLIGDIIGTILFAIPLVVISVIGASLLECFLVLPGHLQHSFRRHCPTQESAFRQRFNAGFARFRDTVFRTLATRAIHAPFITVSAAVAIFIISLSLIINGWVNFNFFPSPDGRLVHAIATFGATTDDAQKRKFLQHLEDALAQTTRNMPRKIPDQDIVQTILHVENFNPLTREDSDTTVSLSVELLEPDARLVSNGALIRAWRKNIVLPASIESLTITAPRGGPPGRDIDIEITGSSPAILKQAAERVKALLANFPGISALEDDMPYGKPQLIFTLKPQGRALGLTTESVGAQVRAAFTGAVAQIYHQQDDEIEVRVELPESEQDDLFTLEKLPIITAGGEVVLLRNIASLRAEKGIDVLRRTDTKLTVRVRADVDASITNSNAVLARLQQDAFVELRESLGVRFSLGGRAEEQADTLNDMKYGLGLALAIIYIILAWVFSSYLWPLAVMLAIPLGLSGAILGHVVMQLDLTLLSLFGFFGLSGIVINDSIILIVRYRELLADGLPLQTAIVEASCQRLRAVLLTSLTTIGGLTPLLFEKSLQAQFLIPMATAISFGLLYATALILLVIPASLAIIESWRGNAPPPAADSNH